MIASALRAVREVEDVADVGRDVWDAGFLGEEGELDADDDEDFSGDWTGGQEEQGWGMLYGRGRTGAPEDECFVLSSDSEMRRVGT